METNGTLLASILFPNKTTTKPMCTKHSECFSLPFFLHEVDEVDECVAFTDSSVNVIAK